VSNVSCVASSDRPSNIRHRTKRAGDSEAVTGPQNILAAFMEMMPGAGRNSGNPIPRAWEIGGAIFIQAVLRDVPPKCLRTPPIWLAQFASILMARRASGSRGHMSLACSFEELEFPPLDAPVGGAGFELLALLLPRASLRSMAHQSGPAAGHAIEPHLAGFLASYMDLMSRELPNLSGDTISRLGPATRILIGACIARPLSTSTPADAPTTSLLLERARRTVQRHIASADFGPADLCRLLAVSRSKLYRAFASSGGIARFITRQRLLEARRRLADPLGTASIHVIGGDVGFREHSTFSRAFRREFGVSPSEARERAAGAAAPPFAAMPFGQGPEPRGSQQSAASSAKQLVTGAEFGMSGRGMGF
jgi:AraC-like DNA-binding protein